MNEKKFKLYRFSPIKTEEELIQAIRHIHFECYKLCKNSFGKYLSNSGNVGVFCHDMSEFEYLKTVRNSWCYPSGNPYQKYFELRSPIKIESSGDVQETIYTHLYIRKPDIYRGQVGDLDFYLDQNGYVDLKSKIESGFVIPGARIFPRPDLDMIELFDFESDVLAYVSTHKMSEEVRLKLSEHTKL